MSVSLVKISPSTVVYVTGHNHAGYLPEGDVAVHATIESARSTLAWELDSLADSVAEWELAEARETYADASAYDAACLSGEAMALSHSISGMAEYVKADPDGDITYGVAHSAGWTTYADTGDGIDTAYWIQTSTIGEQFGDDTDSDEYWDVVDALQS